MYYEDCFRRLGRYLRYTFNHIYVHAYLTPVFVWVSCVCVCVCVLYVNDSILPRSLSVCLSGRQAGRQAGADAPELRRADNNKCVLCMVFGFGLNGHAPI